MIGRSLFKGIAGSVGLLGFYFATVIAISGWMFAWAQFLASWYWIVGLTIGFGVQIFLFTYLRALHRERMAGAVAVTTGTVSGLTMVACCTHYLVNVLPIVGISAFAAIVGQYQQELFIVGAVSNITGIAYMARQLILTKQSNEICHE